MYDKMHAWHTIPLFKKGTLSEEPTLIFISPILEGKANALIERKFTETEEDLLKNLGISKYQRWIQRNHDNDFLIHQLEGENHKQSFADLKEAILKKSPVPYPCKIFIKML